MEPVGRSQGRPVLAPRCPPLAPVALAAAALVALVAVGVATSACSPTPPERARATPSATSAASRTTPSAAKARARAAPPDEPPAPAASAAQAVANPTSLEPVRLRVGGDPAVYYVRGAARPIVYLHGRCGNPFAWRAWVSAVVGFGTLVLVGGDVVCDGGAKRKYSSDVGALDARIARAVRAVKAGVAVEERAGAEADVEPIVLIGYSEGALRAESLAARNPKRYPRVMVGGSPHMPAAASFAKSEAVVVFTGELDRAQPMREATGELVRAGVRARFFALPKAGHGDYGPDATRVMGEALAWMLAPRTP